jgi:hypothetical protein
VENFKNMEMSIIKKWSKVNKLPLNDQKSKVMLISRRRKERRAIDMYEGRTNTRVDPKFSGLTL